MKYIRYFLLSGAGIVFIVMGMFGQILSHPLTLDRGKLTYISRPDVPDTLRTLAIMVQFQPDEDSRTTGNGQFDLSAGNPDIINPPPHDAAYFEYHLEFARRYYKDVSNGRLTIEYTVWDHIFTLSDVMGAYSPRTPGDFSEIGKLFEEAWLLAASEAPDISFNNFDTFVIFHAGVGRDIDLTSIYGFDPTPLDIPSLYLGPKGLKRIFGENYDGVEVGQNGFRITNTLILPETQNRMLQLVTGDQLLELGMNGLVCAMFGSRLGLPDLFNTDTGRSGIGRFGLMDGQAIFSFMGLFPPELSAWEKYFLGWIEPVTVQPGVHTFDLPAVALREPGSVLRVPINAREYYLVENRHRNPFGTGQTLTLIQNGEKVSFTVDRDRTEFNAFNISSIGGVVLDVDVYDWSLPGGYVEAEDIFYDGGIIIWHIDERIIDARIDENRINADIENRGIRVVEADGSQDIGRQFGFLQPGQGSEDGTQFDYWYAGNPAPVYNNRFDASTFPASKSNTGAPSNVAIYDFSGRSPVMSVTIRVGTDKVSLLDGFPFELESYSIDTSPVPFADGILFVNDGQLNVVSKKGILTHIQETYEKAVTTTPAWYEENNDIVLFTGSGNSTVTKWIIGGEDNNGVKIFEAVEDFNLESEITAGPALLENGICLVGTAAGDVFSITGSELRLEASLSDGNKIIDIHIFDGVNWTATSPTRLYYSGDGGEEFQFPETVHRTTAYRENERHIVAGVGEGSLIIMNPQVQVMPTGQDLDVQAISTVSDYKSFSINQTGEISFGVPIAVDLNKDGLINIITVLDNKLYGFNRNRSVLDFFPVDLGDARLNDSYIIAADFDGNGSIDIAVANNNDQIRFHNAKGNSTAGTPIAVGERVIGSPLIFEADGSIALAFITADNLLYAFKLSGEWDPGRILWGQERMNNRRENTQQVLFQSQPISDEFLPENRAYNWPNPVYDGSTNIRYYLSESADVSISIYEMNGDRITSFNGPGVGGMDNEIVWDVSDMQSGVYLGRIEARNANQSKVVFIKIAVVR